VSKSLNRGLWREVAVMAFDTLRTNKMRSALTILGVVIGITSIVGMTSLIRGFDESLRDMIRQLGPNTIIVSKASAVSLAAGADFSELIRRPNLTVDDARAIERLAPSVGVVDIWMGQGLGGTTAERVFYGGDRTPTLGVIGATDGRGEHPVSRRVRVGDFLATIDRRLGIDAERVRVRDPAGRPVPLLQARRRADSTIDVKSPAA